MSALVEAAIRTIPQQAVEVRGLTKIYGRRRGAVPVAPALDGVDLAIPRGSLFGLLGPNGAGKSTLINILGGLVIKTSGTARIWDIDIDRDPRSARAAIGIVPQELNIDSFFTPREYLEVQAGLYAVPRRERRTMEILETVGLADKADAYARTLSGGMRRRLLIAKAMVHDPPVLVLDEPTAGVDIELREQLWEKVRDLNRRGVTVLLTTHYMEEAEEMCDRIAIINHGRVVACDETERLLRRLDSKTLHITLAAPAAGVPEALQRFSAALTAPDRITLRYQTARTRAGEILAALSRTGLEVADISTEETDLADIFRQLTRGPAAEPGTAEREDEYR